MSPLELVGALAAVVALLGVINHRFIGLPDTLGIMAAGSLFALVMALVGRHVPGVVEWAEGVASHIDFTEIVFQGLLGVLLFAGSLHTNLADLARHRGRVFLLATLGVAISTLVVGFGAHLLLALVGVPIALKYCLLFGALISPTDPIAVLALLKTIGAPKSLEIDIAGESLFNDGTGVVAFLFMLGIVSGAYEPTLATVAKLLALEVLGGLLLGLVVGYAAFLVLKGVDSYPVEILLTIALATGGFALAQRLHVSAPLAVVVMGLVIGNHGAESAMSDTTRRYMFQFWELVEEILNLMLFGLMALTLLAFAGGDRSWLPALALVPVVLVARFASVGLPALMLRRFIPRRTPHAVKVLTWGGLRGGISVALALSLPAFPGRDVLVMATYAVVLFSLLVQAPTLGPLLRKLELGQRK
ncbi:cation:proton antiporter [Ramlibacter sp. PS4R-6]|uniref:cation:proton antiporter n=1 Tax=Ramlibacter sp. PS4R-6 TaxID=3133438 RepID=UPI0030A77C36